MRTFHKGRSSCGYKGDFTNGDLRRKCPFTNGDNAFMEDSERLTALLDAADAKLAQAEEAVRKREEENR